MRLAEQLKRHEGLRLKPYKCTADKSTIGYGRNLDDKGISISEAESMLNADILDTQAEVSRALPIYNGLSPVRQDVLANMAFNMGVTGLLKFKKMISALELGDYVCASEEMLNSRWANQVGRRSAELARQMVRGEYI